MILMTVLCGSAGYASTLLLDQSLPWNANVALTAVVFYSIDFGKAMVCGIKKQTQPFFYVQVCLY
ncbi:hypothetical protein ACEQPO_01505 [Bacillus sp. SL00103]